MRRISIALWIVALAAGIVLAARTLHGLDRPLNIFPAYYTAAKLIANGEQIAQFYDDAWFMRRAAEFEPSVVEIHNTNTPMMGFFFLPLSEMSYDAARRLTSAADFAALIGAVFLIMAELRIPNAWRAIGFAGIFSSPTTLTNLEHAQVYPIVLLLLVLAWRAWRRNAEGSGGALIGIAVAFKSAGLFLGPLMILERRWKALLGAAAAIGLLMVITFPYVGVDGWAAYLRSAAGLMARPGLSSAGYLSMTGFTRNLLGDSSGYLNAPILAVSTEAVMMAGFVLAAFRVVTLTDDHDITFSMAIMLSLILVPVTSLFSLCLAFLPAFVIFSRLQHDLISPLGRWLAAGAVLTFAPGVDRLSVLARWGGPLFAYFPLYGLIILTVLCMVLGIQKRAPALRQASEAVRSG
jgi:hypothetical protein